MNNIVVDPFISAVGGGNQSQSTLSLNERGERKLLADRLGGYGQVGTNASSDQLSGASRTDLDDLGVDPEAIPAIVKWFVDTQRNGDGYGVGSGTAGKDDDRPPAYQ